jgi:uncharacterized protein YodC (DUF2158 family)
MKGGFETGALVRLKSGGPKMTVMQRTGDQCACCWFVADQEHHRSFPTGAIERAGFLTGDLFEKYDLILESWPASSLGIQVERLTGPVEEHRRLDGPKSGSALRDALELIHGESVAAEYRVKIVDVNRKSFRGVSQVALPDTRPGFAGKKPRKVAKSGRPR